VKNVVLGVGGGLLGESLKAHVCGLRKLGDSEEG